MILGLGNAVTASTEDHAQTDRRSIGPLQRDKFPRLVCTLARHLRLAHPHGSQHVQRLPPDSWRRLLEVIWQAGTAHQEKFSLAHVSTERPVVRRSGIPLPLSLMPSVPEKVLTCARPLPHRKTPSFGSFLSPRASALPAQSVPCQAERVQPVTVVP